MTTLTSSLIIRLIDQVSAPAKEVSRNLLGIQKASGNLRNVSFGDRLQGAIRQNDAALANARAGLIDTVGAFYALRGAIAAPVREAMQFESAMADVKKVVDFPTPEGLNQFKDGLIAMSREIPLSVNGLAAIAAAAGQAGIAGDDLTRFTEAAAKVGTAFDISADQAGTSMSKLMTGLGLSIEEVTLLTDAMNHLSNSQAATASEILDVVNRTGAQARQFGFSATEVSAFASAMIAAGAQSEVAATSFRNMGLSLTRGESATLRQREALSKLGLEATDVAERMQRDAVGTTLDVMERIAELPEATRAAVSNDLFGSEARALGPLLTNLDLIRESLGLVSDEAQYAGSAFREFQVRSETFENSVQLFNNRLSAMKVVIGAALIPAINDLMDAIAPVIDRVATFAAEYPNLFSNVMLAVGGLVAFKGALAGLRFVGLLGRGGALVALAAGFNTVGRAALGVWGAARGSMALNAALAGMSGRKAGVVTQVGAALRGIAGVTGLRVVAGAITAVASVIGGISAPIWAGIAAAVAAVGAAWKYWDRVAAVLSGIGQAIGDQFAPAMEAIKAKLEPLEPVLRTVGRGFDYLGERLAAAKQRWSDLFGSGLFSQETLSDADSKAIQARTKEIATAVFDTVKWVFDDFFIWWGNIPGKLIDAIAQIDLSDLIRWPEPPQWWKQLFGDGGAQGIDIPEVPISQVPGFDQLPDHQQGAASTLDDARRAGVPMPGELDDLRTQAADIREEIAALREEIESVDPTPMGNNIKSALEADARALTAELETVEAAIAEGEARAEELIDAMRALDSTTVTLTVDSSSVDQALRKMQQISTEKAGIDSRAGMPRPAVGGPPASSPVVVDGARAGGGDVKAGKTYLVGEEGPELVTPDKDGFVHTARDTARIMREYVSAPMAGIAGVDPGVGASLRSAVSGIAGSALGLPSEGQVKAARSLADAREAGGIVTSTEIQALTAREAALTTRTKRAETRAVSGANSRAREEVVFAARIEARNLRAQLTEVRARIADGQRQADDFAATLSMLGREDVVPELTVEGVDEALRAADRVPTTIGQRMRQAFESGPMATAAGTLRTVAAYTRPRGQAGEQGGSVTGRSPLSPNIAVAEEPENATRAAEIRELRTQIDRLRTDEREIKSEVERMAPGAVRERNEPQARSRIQVIRGEIERVIRQIADLDGQESSRIRIERLQGTMKPSTGGRPIASGRPGTEGLQSRNGPESHRQRIDQVQRSAGPADPSGPITAMAPAPVQSPMLQKVLQAVRLVQTMGQQVTDVGNARVGIGHLANGVSPLIAVSEAVSRVPATADRSEPGSAPSVAARGRPVSVTITGPLTGPISIANGGDPMEIVDRIQAALEDRLSRSMRGAFSD